MIHTSMIANLKIELKKPLENIKSTFYITQQQQTSKINLIEFNTKRF